MALTVGTDSYISQADATTYITSNYATTDAKAVAWAALSSADKDAWLRKAAQTLDRQPVVGLKASDTQTMAFPRAIWTEGYLLNTTLHPLLNRGANWYVQTEVPTAVKNAQVEIALQLAVGISQRVELQRQGVKSFSLGKLSENYGSGKQNPLPYEAQELLRPFLAGAVPIC